MSSRNRRRARSPRGRVLSCNEGFIVLAPLVAIAVLLLVGVLVGKVVHSTRYAYEVPLGERERRVAEVPVEVRYGALVTLRVEPRQGVWVRALGGGRLAVFESETSARVIGFVEESALPSSTVPGADR